MYGVLVDLRNEWAVQTLVLFSFALQVFLLMFADIRRRNVSLVPRMLLWMAYQLADSTALFTLGHLSISSSLHEHQLVAFWASFLLVHLGVQDTIIAYSFEDNRLWLRHLQTLVVQVLVAAYVLYKYIPGSETLVRVAAVLMFVVGVLKYGERIWALRCAGLDSILSSLEKPHASDRPQGFGEVLRGGASEDILLGASEDILLGAHSLLDVCKGLFVGLRREQPGSVLKRFFGQNLDSLIEMELSLMYDIMYTKAAVIHTWYGCCIRVVSLVATAAAFLLFQFSSKSGHKKNDVAVTYVLLVGALVLEMISLLRAAGSTWTRAFLHARKWHWLDGAVLSLRRLVGAGRYRRWSGSIGQYNLFESCFRDTREVTGGMARFLGDWWNEVHHSVSVRISDGTQRLVMNRIRVMMRRPREEARQVITSNQLRHNELLQDLGWRDGEQVDFEDMIITLHVATEIVLSRSRYVRYQAFWEATKVLSNYMMFLLVVRPYMLPGAVRLSRFVLARDHMYSVMRQKGRHGRLVFAMQTENLDPDRTTAYSRGVPSAYSRGVRLGNDLLGSPNAGFFGDIFGAWVEMLRYVADRCSRESHASQLSTGGEFVTIVWLMSAHMDLLD